MSHPRVLVAGVGNIFLGDDAFGVEVVRRLGRQELPEGVHVVDFGIRGLDLTYALLEDYEAVILVDAAPRGGTPGTLYVIEPSSDSTQSEPAAEASVDPHGMDPVKVLRLARAMGSQLARALVVGCEPTPCADFEEMQPEMSEPVRWAVDEAVGLVESLATRLVRGEAVGAS